MSSHDRRKHEPKAVAAPAVTDAPVEAVATSFSPTSKRKSRRRKSWTFLRVPTTARRRCTCAKARWWLTRARRNIGYLKDITPYGATFQPLDLKGYQKEKALLYVLLRDAYERLYRYESLRARGKCSSGESI